MQHSEENNALGFNAVEDRVWELRNDGAPHIAVNLCEHLGIAFDGVKGRIDSEQKPFAKAFELVFVIREGNRKISSDRPAVDEWQRH